MELDRAKEIIQTLADGVDPYTGEHFPTDGPYQRADTVRALYTILEAAESGTKPKKPVDPTKPRAGGKWTEEEEQRLRDAFNARRAIDDIARDHGRTPGAITARLVKLGLLEDTPDTRSGRGRAPDAGLSRRLVVPERPPEGGSPSGVETDQGNRPSPPPANQISPKHPIPSDSGSPRDIDPADCPF